MAMKKPNLCLGAVSLFLPCNISKYRQTVPLLHMEPIIHQGDQVAVQGDGCIFLGLVGSCVRDSTRLLHRINFHRLSLVTGATRYRKF